MLQGRGWEQHFWYKEGFSSLFADGGKKKGGEGRESALGATRWRRDPIRGSSPCCQKRLVLFSPKGREKEKDQEIFSAVREKKEEVSQKRSYLLLLCRGKRRRGGVRTTREKIRFRTQEKEKEKGRPTLPPMPLKGGMTHRLLDRREKEKREGGKRS